MARAPWQAALTTIGTAFESERRHYHDLRHFVTFADDTNRRRVSGPPWIRGQQMHVQPRHGGAPRPVFGMQHGIAFHQRGPYISDAAKPATHRRRMLFYSAGFYGCGDNLARTNGAFDAFRPLAARAWACLPTELRDSLTVNSYLDPAEPGGRDSWEGWLFTLYALAWQHGPGNGLSAPRCVSVANDEEMSTYDLEYLIGLPDPVPEFSYPEFVSPEMRAPVRTRPKAGIVSEALAEPSNVFRADSSSWADHGVTIPPGWFDAFLEPDVFLASKLAVDHLIGGALTPVDNDVPTPTGRVAAPAGARMVVGSADNAAPPLASADAPDPAIWISSTELKDKTGLTPDRVSAAARRKKWHVKRHRNLRWYKRADVRGEWADIVGDLI